MFLHHLCRGAKDLINENCRRAKDVYLEAGVRLVVLIFKILKPRGVDNIFPALLMEPKNYIRLPPKGCKGDYSFGIHRRAKMVCILEAATKDPLRPKSFEPIGRAPFVLKKASSYPNA